MYVYDVMINLISIVIGISQIIDSLGINIYKNKQLENYKMWNLKPTKNQLK